MLRITVVFRHGFEDEPVLLRIDGKTVMDKEHVRTRMQIDRADAVDVELEKPGASHTFGVELGGRGRTLAGELVLPEPGTVFIDLDGHGAATAMRLSYVAGVHGDL
jgi:hypothetical protein